MGNGKVAFAGAGSHDQHGVALLGGAAGRRSERMAR